LQNENIATIKAAMAQSITACLAMSTGKPLLDLLRKYAASMSEYAQILMRLFAQALGDGSASSSDTENTTSTSAATNLKGFLNKTQHQLSPSKHKKQREREPLDTQLRVVYGCMAYNTCVRAREWLCELRKMGATSLQRKYRNGCRRELDEAAHTFLAMEEQALELMAIAVRRKMEPLFTARDLEMAELKAALLTALDDYAGNCAKLMAPSAAEHFVKGLVAQMAQSLFSAAANLRVNVDVLPIVESAVLKRVPARSMRRMQLFMARCFALASRVVQLGSANAGAKYSKVPTEETSSSSAKNKLFSKFFGGGAKRKDSAAESEAAQAQSSSELKNKKSGRTAIAQTVFAREAVRFYIDRALKLRVVDYVPSYKELFGDDDDDDDDDDELDRAAEAVSESKENVDAADEASDSPLPDLTSTATVTSASGFAVKKKRTHSKAKRKKRAPPTMSAPRAPAMADVKSAPAPVATKKESFGLSSMSFAALKVIKMNERWTVLEKIMALRGFDVDDQQTIRAMCEDAQANVDATQ